MTKQIALDGPAGAGKSSVAKKVASQLNYLFIDSGAMYRAIAYLALEAELAIDDATAWVKLAKENPITLAENSSIVNVANQDVSGFIRSAEVTAHTRYAAGNPGVREILVDRQRELGGLCDIVMEGRDIGTVVLPSASHKIYLDASPDVRARRRTDELKRTGQPANYDDVLATVIERDHSDKTRAVSPLKQADDAVYLDSSAMSFDEVVVKIIDLCR